jgi:excisionase family DNA binding protein
LWADFSLPTLLAVTWWEVAGEGGEVAVRTIAAERDALVAELFALGADGAAEEGEGRFLRTREVALLFQVSERAVTDWARKGRIRSVRTPGGHRRYPATHVKSLLEASGQG